MYEIEFSITAEKQFYKLEKNMQIRIINALERIKIRPHANIQRLVGVPFYKFRVSDYRLIIDIKNDRLILFVIEIKHRKNVYK